MMRALWTGASGMTAQQTNLDTIANNFSNVGTTGYKTEQAQFASLLYQKIQTKTTNQEGSLKPVVGQVGLGVRTTAIVSKFTQGNLLESSGQWHMAIDGEGFFQVRMQDGTTAYTRNGSFGLSIAADGVTLATADGYPVLNTAGTPITLAETLDTAKLTMDEYGNLMYPNEENQVVRIGQQVGLAQFNNPSGLLKLSGSLYAATENSGEVRLENEDAALKKSKVLKGYLEGSNVETANEIVNLIVAQRAYEMNSKSIQAADEMLQQANNLR